LTTFFARKGVDPEVRQEESCSIEESGAEDWHEVRVELTEYDGTCVAQRLLSTLEYAHFCSFHVDLDHRGERKRQLLNEIVEFSAASPKGSDNCAAAKIYLHATTTRKFDDSERVGSDQNRPSDIPRPARTLERESAYATTHELLEHTGILVRGSAKIGA
jgi:hypothetical protein